MPAHPPEKRRRASAPAAAVGSRRRAAEPFVREHQYRLPEDVARRVWLGHPWVYRDAIPSRPVGEPTGTLVDLFGGNRDFVGRGYVDQEHPVVVRILTRDPVEKVYPGAGAIAARLGRAVKFREITFAGKRPDAVRLFAGESEGLPGVTVDMYGDFVVAQWLSAGALPWRDELYSAIESEVKPRGIYEQRRLRPLAGAAPPEPATRARGAEAPLEIVVEEAGCRFGVDVTAPLGVGFFPDLRRGRDLVAALAPGRRVLNLFSYTGAFSVRAAKAGATEVVAVDNVAKGHARARRNYELSGLDPTRMEQVTGDARKTLGKFSSRGRRFDLVVCDPPTFSHGAGSGASFSVGKDMGDLAAAAFSVLEPGGLLAFSSNSTRLTAADLDRAVAEGAALARTGARIIDRVGLPPDFPVAPGFPEGNYLKFLLAVKSGP